MVQIGSDPFLTCIYLGVHCPVNYIRLLIYVNYWRIHVKPIRVHFLPIIHAFIYLLSKMLGKKIIITEEE